MHVMIRRPLPLALAVAEKALLEFSNQWLAGLQPQLSLETGNDGQILVNSRVAAVDVPTRAPVVPHHAEEAPGRCQAGEALQRPRPHPLINGVSFEEQLLGQPLQQLTKLFKLYWNLMKLFRTPLPPR